MRNEESIEAAGTQLVDRVADWLMSHALGDSDVEQIFDGCCHRLHAAGIPLWRGLLTFRTLHPLFASTSLIWRRGDGADTQHFLHGEAFTSDEYFRSPMYHLFKTQLPFLRRRLVGDGALLDFPALLEFHDQGATDYFAYLIPFARDDEPGPHTDGIIGSWATDRPSGFTDQDIRSLMRIQRRLVVSCKVQIKNQVTKDVLDTYLGPDAGRQVLNGQIKRGDGETIHAVIWFSDMRDSTRLADSLSGEQFLATVNSYFECTAGAVIANGGEVLRFIGDAVLAIFPIRGDGDDVRTACEKALQASREAEARLAALNSTRRADGLEPLDFGLGLHVGDVIYGNIGVPERLEFSVIGPAANEVARLENLTKKLKRRVLVSGDFAGNLNGGFDSLGEHDLRGVGQPLEVLAPR